MFLFFRLIYSKRLTFNLRRLKTDAENPEDVHSTHDYTVNTPPCMSCNMYLYIRSRGRSPTVWSDLGLRFHTVCMCGSSLFFLVLFGLPLHDAGYFPLVGILCPSTSSFAATVRLAFNKTCCVDQSVSAIEFTPSGQFARAVRQPARRSAVDPR